MIVWLDFETTGIDPRTGTLLEMAMIATDDDLNQIGEPFESIIKPLHLRGYEVMDDFVYEMHTKSGLLSRLYEGHHGDTDKGWGRVTPSAMAQDLPRLGDVERAAIEWVTRMFDVPTAPPLDDAAHQALKEAKARIKGTPLGGNTVHFDKRWAIEHMSDFEAMFSHRIYDVSSFTEEAKRSAPEIYKGRPGLGPDGKPVSAHRALDDIRNSIATARYYRSTWFKAPATV